MITSGGRPVARLVPVAADVPREFGFDRGVLHVPADFDAPLPDEVALAFER